MLIMDVGSTKQDVVDAARRALGAQFASFVPAHPNTGKEVAGVSHADAQLYRGAKVVLTPTAETYAPHVERAQALWQALGCQVRVMAPDTHDKAFAAISHLPHLLAFAIMNSVTAQPERDDFLALAGPGFRDFTRIAAGEPTMWRDILHANKCEVIAQAQHFQQALAAFEAALQADDTQALQTLIAQASQARAQCCFKAATLAPTADPSNP